MSMKRLSRIGLGIASLALAVTAYGQTDVTSQVHVDRAQIQAQRQEIVAANMTLTEQEAAAFWPMYREYRGELATTGDRTVKLIEDYAKSYDNMTDAQAETMLNDWLDIQKKNLDIHDKYVKKMKKVLPGAKLARFFQIENKLDSIVMNELANEIPLVPAAAKP